MKLNDETIAKIRKAKGIRVTSVEECLAMAESLPLLNFCGIEDDISNYKFPATFGEIVGELEASLSDEDWNYILRIQAFMQEIPLEALSEWDKANNEQWDVEPTPKEYIE